MFVEDPERNKLSFDLQFYIVKLCPARLLNEETEHYELHKAHLASDFTSGLSSVAPWEMFTTGLH